MRSIAGRQLHVLLAGGLLACAGSGAIMMVLTRHALIQQFDSGLVSRAEFLGTLAEFSEYGELEFDEDVVDAAEFGQSELPAYFQVWWIRQEPESAHPSFIELARSQSLSESSLTPRLRGAGQPVVEATLLPDGRQGRAVTIVHLVDRADGDISPAVLERLRRERNEVAITVAADTTDVRVLLSRIGLGVTIANGVLLLMLVSTSLLAVRKGMRPIRDANDRVSEIDVAGLRARLNSEQAPIEVRPLLEEINRLLARLEQSFERERVSRAMLAHELRNPIAELLAQAEIAMRWSDDPALMKKNMSAILDGARDMQRLVDTLLRVAKVQSGHAGPEWASVDLASMAREVVSSYEPLIQSRALVLADDTVEAALVRSDAELLRIVVTNVVGNAIEHAREGGDVRLHVVRNNGVVRLECANAIEPGREMNLETLSKPFQTGGQELDRQSTHIGLGLAATRNVCAALGATLKLKLEADRFIARIEVPTDETA